MMIETKRAIARNVAKYLIETFGEEIENLTYSEVLQDEVPGVDEDVFDSIVDMTRAYVEVARVNIWFDEDRVRNDGTVISREELLKEMQGTAMAVQAESW